MGLVRVAVAAVSLLLAEPIHAGTVAPWRTYIAQASIRFGVPVAWIERVMLAESAGRTRLGNRPITSRAGAMGLMQLMPATWSDMRRTLGLGTDPYDPHDNILAGTFYLRLMYDRFGYPGLFGAYNAGPARYSDHLARGTPLPHETRAYLVTVAGRGKIAPENTPSDGLFAVRRSPDAPGVSAPAASAPSLLFVRLTQR